MVKRILCYGDSNTWGYIPSSEADEVRYSSDIRWTGVLQSKLGSQYLIIEEGLNSRTTNLDDPDRHGRNGLVSLPEILKKHTPIDLVILSLGTNDLKKKFNREPKQIAEGIQKLISCIQEHLKVFKQDFKIFLLVPAIPKLKFIYDSYQYPDLEVKARQLPVLYQSIAESMNVEILDLSQSINSSDVDGAHLMPEEHLKIAELIFNYLKKLN